MGKKSFINKKHAVTFRLAPRSQRDPLIATDASAYVLAPLSNDMRAVSLRDGEMSTDARLTEQEKCGIYFVDDYNYLQHLKDVNEVEVAEIVEDRVRVPAKSTSVDSADDIATEAVLTLPSSVFESRGLTLKVGLLNQAAPQPGPHPELDPDVVAFLDDDVDDTAIKNDLEDDFVLQANAPGSVDDNNDGSFSQRDSGTVTRRELPGIKFARDSNFDTGSVLSFGSDEVKSRFTNYSLTSSTMRRAEGLKHLDQRFEKIYDEYDEELMGDLETDTQIEGVVEPNSDRMLNLAKEYREMCKSQRMRDWDHDDDVVRIIKDRLSEIEETSVEKDEDEQLGVPEKEELVDCKTLHSSRSNGINNGPTVIMAPKKRKMRSSESRSSLSVTASNAHPRFADTASCLSTLSNVRRKDESRDEKKLRKQIVKLERRKRRIEKKANKEAFHLEEMQQNLVHLNVLRNLHQIKLS